MPTEPFFGFSSLCEVEVRLTELYPGLIESNGGRLDAGYNEEFLQAAAALDHFSPGEYAKLTNRLKDSGIRIAAWTSAVAKTARSERDQLKQQQQLAGGAAAALPELRVIEPWPQAVDPRVLLDEVSGFIQRFVVMGPNQLAAMTLWIAFTHVFEVAEVAPRLAFVSPQKRCGKSTAEALLQMLCPRPWTTSGVTPALVPRLISLYDPPVTLIMDEVDTYASRGLAEKLRGILNAGHRKGSATISLLVREGGSWVPKQISVFAPISFATIRALPDTWEDRSIKIAMKRRLPTEPVERLTHRNLKTVAVEADILARKLTRWAADSMASLRTAKPAIPPGLDSRAEDNWELPLAIADLAGVVWGMRARTAAVTISYSRSQDDTENDLSLQLLGDVRQVIRGGADEMIPTQVLIAGLRGLHESLWTRMPRTGKPLTERALARMLGDFGIHPGPAANRLWRGYERKDLEDAFVRYLPADDQPQSVHVSETLGAVVENDDHNASRRTH